MSGEAKFVAKILVAVAILSFVFWYAFFQSGLFNKSTYMRVGSGTIESKEANVLIGAGDISDCEGGEKVTSAILKIEEGMIFTTGDNLHDRASLGNYLKCFGAYWGKYKLRIFPAMGEEDYGDDEGAGYFAYFGEKAGPPGKGYYAYDLGTWRIIVLNSNCERVGGCGQDSEQLKWLKHELEANKSKCTLAYWHEPLFNSGRLGGSPKVRAFWQVLYQSGAELVINGHEHGYERFSPQDPSGKPDEDGIREFIVGTAGYDHSGFMEKAKNSEVRNYDAFGVLKFILAAEKYSWEFIPEEGQSFTDKGEAACVEI